MASGTIKTKTSQGTVLKSTTSTTYVDVNVSISDYDYILVALSNNTKPNAMIASTIIPSSLVPTVPTVNARCAVSGGSVLLVASVTYVNANKIQINTNNANYCAFVCGIV